MAPRLAFIHALNGQYPCHTLPLQTQKYEQEIYRKRNITTYCTDDSKHGTQLNRQVSYSHNVETTICAICVASSRHKDLQRVHQQQMLYLTATTTKQSQASNLCIFTPVRSRFSQVCIYISHCIAHSVDLVATRRVVHCMHDFALYYFMRSYSECLCTFTQFLSCF